MTTSSSLKTFDCSSIVKSHLNQDDIITVRPDNHPINIWTNYTFRTPRFSYFPFQFIPRRYPLIANLQLANL